MNRSREANALVLARMRVADWLDADVDASDELRRLPFEASMLACLEALEEEPKGPSEPGRP